MATVTLNITDSDFIKYRAKIGAALSISFVRKKLTISKLTFLNNTAEQRGGAIDVMFLYLSKLTFVIQTCNFINNQVTNELGKDGALAFEIIYGLKIYSSKFIHNKAGYGGAAFFYDFSFFTTNCSYREQSSPWRIHVLK